MWLRVLDLSTHLETYSAYYCDVKRLFAHQTTNYLRYTTFAWEVLTVHGNELRLFCAKVFPHINFLRRASYIAAVGTIYKVFSFAA